MDSQVPTVNIKPNFQLMKMMIMHEDVSAAADVHDDNVVITKLSCKLIGERKLEPVSMIPSLMF